MTAIKFCGVTRPEDALAAAEAGADAIGLVLWPGSPRSVTLDRAAEIARAVPPFVTIVAVLVSPTVAAVRRVVEQLGVRVVQLHGAVDLDGVLAEGLSVVRAVPLGGDGAPELVDPRATLLLDAHDPLRHGGTGRSIDWDRAAVVARVRRVILAGGLSPANVARAIYRVRPYAVDVSSGIEVAPGVKDPARMRAFAARVREADARASEGT